MQHTMQCPWPCRAIEALKIVGESQDAWEIGQLCALIGLEAWKAVHFFDM